MMIDTHVHVVSEDRTRYPLDPGVSTNPWYETHPCSAPELRALMQRAGVDRAVLVQGVGAYRYDNTYTLDAAAANPGAFTAVVCTDRAAADPVAALRTLVETRRVRGYRWFTVGDDPRLDEPHALWDALAGLHVPVVLTVLADRLPEVAALVRRIPSLQFALDHCGFADLSRGIPDELGALAALPNLALKASTHVLHTAAAGGDPADLVAELAGRFGGRIMWGSDWSQTHHAPYPEIVEEGRRAARRLRSDHRDAYFAGTALGLWPELR